MVPSPLHRHRELALHYRFPRRGSISRGGVSFRNRGRRRVRMVQVIVENGPSTYSVQTGGRIASGRARSSRRHTSVLRLDHATHTTTGHASMPHRLSRLGKDAMPSQVWKNSDLATGNETWCTAVESPPMPQFSPDAGTKRYQGGGPYTRP